MRRFLVCLLILGCCAGATVRTVACSGDIASAVQSAIGSSVDGDEVSIGAGSCTASGHFSWASKNIDLHGAGESATIITFTTTTAIIVVMADYTKASSRIHDFTLINNSPENGFLLLLDASSALRWSYGWRIDHMKFVGKAGASENSIFVQGVTFGLIDHVTFDLSLGNAGILQQGYMTNLDGSLYTPKINGVYSISLPLDLGTEKAIYIEDCTFTNGGSGRFYATWDSDFGAARVVIRHSAFQGVVYNHWTRNATVDGVKYEVYNNTVTCDGSGNTSFMRLEAGTGVVWGNTINSCSSGIVIDERRGVQFEASGILGTCDGTKAWDGNIEPSGWPCLGQVGRGSGAPGSQASAPLYAWNNGSAAGCATGGSCTNTTNITPIQVGGTVPVADFLQSTPHSNGDVDYVNGGSTPMPGYTPYTYPHPLQGTPVAPTITTTSPLTAGTVGVAYSLQFAASGSTPITWTATGVPSGLTLSSGGLLSGTPTAAATSTIHVTAANGTAPDAAGDFSLTISAASPGSGAQMTGSFTGQRGK